MRRWIVPIVLLVLSTILLFLHRSQAGLLADTDTAVALRAIHQRTSVEGRSPFSYFASDWPLENHFYRPVPSLSLWLDSKLFGASDSGFGFTNFLIVAVCIWLLFWFLYELTELQVLAGACAFLFSLWIVGLPSFFVHLVQIASALSLFAFAWKRHGIVIGISFGVVISGAFVADPASAFLLLIASLAGSHYWQKRIGGSSELPWESLLLYYASAELGGLMPGLFPVSDMGTRTLNWVPGRTATLMALFALLSMAAFARYVRLASQRVPPRELTPLDLPATRTSVQFPIRKFVGWPWILGYLVSGALALCSYEQAIMLPAVILGVAIIFRARGVRASLPLALSSWLLLPAYAFVRYSFVASTVSRYQGQQFRNGMNVYNDIIATALPGFSSWTQLAGYAETGLFSLLDVGLIAILVMFAANVAGIVRLRSRWQFGYGALGLCVVAYLPMAWLKYFGHYAFWPASLRTLYVGCLIWAGAEAFVSAVSPRVLQAPTRPSPAPGSLPHP